MENHEKWMRRCLQLAKAGEGTVSPNPLVGSVIVCDHKIIGEGFHHHSGGPHAEVVAVNSVKDKSLLRKSTIYVTLEPCSHFGKTPPCANLIVENEIPRVVISCLDPFVEVAGKGVAFLKENGVDVIENVLLKEGEWLNRRFFTFQRNKRPYIILKWAQSQDGFIDINRNSKQKGIHWITSPRTKLLTHRWRSFEDAILIGKNTALNDNPLLTVRAINGKNPARVLIDNNLEVSLDNNVFSDDSSTIVFNKLKNEKFKDVTLIKVPEDSSYLDYILKSLFDQGVQSIVIEGGVYTIDQFIKCNIWDEAKVLIGNIYLNEGLKAPFVSGKLIDNYKYGGDYISIFSNK